MLPDNLIAAPNTQLAPNTYLPAALAYALTDALPDNVQVSLAFGGYSINPTAVPKLASYLQEIIAYTVSTLIDAGSERDAVMENDELYEAIYNELGAWCVPEVTL